MNEPAVFDLRDRAFEREQLSGSARAIRARGRRRAANRPIIWHGKADSTMFDDLEAFFFENALPNMQ